MGPVSFDAVDLGTDRREAVDATSAVRMAGYWVDLNHTDERFLLMVRSTDYLAVRGVLDARYTERFLPTQLPIIPLEVPPAVSLRVPGSKSHTNRALVCAALADGVSRLAGVLFADDTEAMLDVLDRLGIGLEVDREEFVVTVVGGSGSLPDGPAVLDARQSGTTSRFVLPMLALGSGTYLLDGHEQMRSRPFGDLISAVAQLGARVEGSSLPLTVNGNGVLRGGTVALPGSISSQFLSGVLLSAPCSAEVTKIEITDELVSKPYVDLTLATMRSFGATVENHDYREFIVAPTGYKARDVVLESDASAASYFFAAAAITGGRVRVEGLGRNTLQGDLRFVDLLEQMGAEVVRGEDFTEVAGVGPLRGIDVDMSDISDTAQSLAVVAPFAETPTRVRGIGFIRKKETDRIAAVVHELTRLGIAATEEADGFVVEPGTPQPGVVETYDDHRMVMSFALLGLVHPGIVIDNPNCVSKTFPNFFDVLAQLG